MPKAMNVKLLSSIDLENYCKILRIPLRNVMSKDLFLRIKPKPGAYIINMENSDEGNGTHWTALLLTSTTAIYFDSFGLSIPSYILDFIIRQKPRVKIIYSTDQIQTLPSVLCGWYCLFFLWFMTVNNKTSTRYRQLLNKHNAFFSLENRQLNERILQALIQRIPAFNNLV